MPAITVSTLAKTFVTKRQAAGLSGSLRALVRPEQKTIDALRGISFEMESGELLGFIGPNGAGKSTTIKILTGILFPTSGDARVLDYVPWQQRRELAYHIGTVFGQRPQLWYHLPAIDTFYLFGKIYELDDKTTHTHIAFLTETFDINEEEGVGVILTSHDAGDLEALCKRVIIINHGQIVYQDKVSTLKRRYLTTKTVSIRYAEQVPADFRIAGTEVLKTSQYAVKLQFDSSATRVENVIAQLAQAGSIVDITIADPPLEEVIRAIYAETGDHRTRMNADNADKPTEK